MGAVGYRKVVSPNGGRLFSNFFANIRMPITIGNDLLQGEVKDALKGSGRFAINTTVGFLGFFDPASQMRLPPQGIEGATRDRLRRHPGQMGRRGKVRTSCCR